MSGSTSPGTSWLLTRAQLLDAGATLRGAVRDVGGGIRVATVLEPGGAVLGVIENPHFRLPEATTPTSGPGR